MDWDSTVHGNQYVRIYVSTHLRIYVSTYQRTYVVSNCPQFARGFPRNVRGFLQIAHDSALGFGAVWAPFGRRLARFGAVGRRLAPSWGNLFLDRVPRSISRHGDTFFWVCTKFLRTF